MPAQTIDDILRNIEVHTTKELNFAHRFETAEIADAVAEFLNASTNLGYACSDVANPEDDEDPSCVIYLDGLGRYLA